MTHDVEPRTGEAQKNRSVGAITWHSTEDAGLPDVGVSVYLGPNDYLYCGEISKDLFEETGGAEHFASDGGWFIVRYNPAPRLIAKVADTDDAMLFIEEIAMWARKAAPT